MFNRKKIFEDGSSIEWVDKETLKYTESGFSVHIWVDFEPGFFSNGRIIKSSSIKTKDSLPWSSSTFIDENKKREIIEKIQKYYKSMNKKCRVET
jgi:hypothetical protein